MMYDQVHALYFSKMLYYKLSFVDQRVDNPEQVIVNDTFTVCTELSEIAIILVGAVIDGSYFTWRLAQATSGRWAMLPIAYVAGAIAITQGVSPDFGKLYSNKATSEGALRHAFAHFASNTEAIAALQGDQRELEIVDAHLKTTMKHNETLIHTQWWYGMLEDFIAKYCVTTVALIVIIVPFFGTKRRDLTPEINSQILSRMRYLTSVTVFQLHAIGGCAMVMRKSMKLSGYLKRVANMLSVLKDLDSQTVADTGQSMLSGDTIRFEDVTVVTPTGKKLVEGLTFEVVPNQNMLITGQWPTP